MHVIEVKDICKTFGDVRALRGITFKVEKGSIVGLVGPNGAGKTTTFNILCGIVKPDYGEVKVFGLNPWENYIEVRKKTGFLPEYPTYPKELTVEKFLTCAAKLKGHPAPKREAIRVMKMFNLLEKRNAKIKTLSRGLLQRLSLAQTFINDPELLLLDEPTSNLDPDSRFKVVEILKSMRGEKTILISSHILTELELICEKLILMKQGLVIDQGSIAELAMKYGLYVTYRIRGRNLSTFAKNIEKLAEDLFISSSGRELIVKVPADKVSEFSKTVKESGLTVIEVTPPDLHVLYRRVLGNETERS